MTGLLLLTKIWMQRLDKTNLTLLVNKKLFITAKIFLQMVQKVKKLGLISMKDGTHFRQILKKTS